MVIIELKIFIWSRNMINLYEYGNIYPDLVWDIWQFFADYSIKSLFIESLEQRGFNPDVAPKCVLDFCTNFTKKYQELGERGGMIQPRTVTQICEKLCESGVLARIGVSGFNNFFDTTNFYQSGLLSPMDAIIKNKELLSRRWNNSVYGFPYIYESNKENVRPIWVKIKGKPQNGTCFNSVSGIITAKHCIKKCDEIKIEGVSADVLKSAKIFESSDIDLVLIKPQGDYHWNNKFMINDGAILDEVMVMGYPNHCGFADRFLTATTGAIAAIGQPYLVKYKLMLLTGKIKGVDILPTDKSGGFWSVLS
jgi:hypothetical protein